MNICDTFTNLLKNLTEDNVLYNYLMLHSSWCSYLIKKMVNVDNLLPTDSDMALPLVWDPRPLPCSTVPACHIDWPLEQRSIRRSAAQTRISGWVTDCLSIYLSIYCKSDDIMMNVSWFHWTLYIRIYFLIICFSFWPSWYCVASCMTYRKIFFADKVSIISVFSLNQIINPLGNLATLGLRFIA